VVSNESKGSFFRTGKSTGDYGPLCALKYGPSGLCALLAFLAYQLLSKEQQKPEPRADIIKLIRLFVLFSVISMMLGFGSQLLPAFQRSSLGLPSGWTSGHKTSDFTGHWEVIDAHDVQTLTVVIETSNIAASSGL
jgi:hypothetical protein